MRTNFTNVLLAKACQTRSCDVGAYTEPVAQFRRLYKYTEPRVLSRLFCVIAILLPWFCKCFVFSASASVFFYLC